MNVLDIKQDFCAFQFRSQYAGNPQLQRWQPQEYNVSFMNFNDIEYCPEGINAPCNKSCYWARACVCPEPFYDKAIFSFFQIEPLFISYFVLLSRKCCYYLNIVSFRCKIRRQFVH